MKHDAHGYWLAEAPAPPDPEPPLRGRSSADVVVIGGGYTGMWAAWHAKALEPGASVVLLEAGSCGHGPSGRNGGFANSMWFSLATLIERFGRGPALEVALAARDSVTAIGDWCSEQGVDAWFRRDGYLQTSAAPAQDGVWDPVVAAALESGHGEAVQVLDRDATRSRCNSPLFRGGAFYPDAATIQPARLALGLRARLIEAGVVVHEHSPAELRRRGDLEVRSGDASIDAGRVILATGGALGAVPGLRVALTVTSSHMVITEPVPDLLERIGWTGGECITDSRAMIHYFRTTPDGRIAFGWGGGRIAYGARLGGRAEVDPGITATAAAHLRRFFPDLEGRSIEHAWGGPIDVSPTHLPLIRSLGDRVFAAFGYTGNGVGPSQMIGRSLASLALGRSDAPARLALIDPPRALVPPEPLRWAGGALIRRAILRKERLEEAGSAPDLPTRLISGIPKRIGIHVGR